MHKELNTDQNQAILNVLNQLQSPLPAIIEGLNSYAETFEECNVSTRTFTIENNVALIEQSESEEIIEPNFLYNMEQPQTDNYFSWDNLSEMTDIQSHITYASTILNKYNWDTSVKTSLQKQLNAIIAKQNDKVLNISVIGEFSTGKSSFINALVGHELLAVNVLQGTTVAITIIEYGTTYAITLVDKGNHQSTQNYNSIDYLREALEHYTTDPSYSDKIDYVRVSLPSDILKNGFRIIDTPGTNSLEQWHEDITRRALKDISDMSIILVDASRPMPETLIDFVDNTIGTTVKDCLFVANKIDIIRQRERNGMVRYIQKKVDMSFEMEESTVLPFASVALTNSFSKEVVPIDNDSWQLTYDSLQSILSFTAQRRIKAQAKKVLRLIDNMYTSLNANIQGVVEKYQKELKVLEYSKQADLASFISRQIALRQKQFIASAREKKPSIESYSDKLSEIARNNINKKIEGCTSLDNLSDYIKNGGLTTDIKTEGSNISCLLEGKFSIVKPLFKQQMSSFQEEFKREFQRLKLLSVSFTVTPRDISIRHNAHSANIGPVASLITDELSKENWAFGGGAAAGAAVGAMVGGPFGALVGGAIGFFAGGGIAPDRDEVKGKVKSKLSIPLTAYFRSICSDCMSNYTTYINDINKNIESEINRYHSTYNSEIQKRIDNWKFQYSKALNNIQKTKIEIANINNRRALIQNLITKLDR